MHAKLSKYKPNSVQYIFNDHLLLAKDSARTEALEYSPPISMMGENKYHVTKTQCNRMNTIKVINKILCDSVT